MTRRSISPRRFLEILGLWRLELTQCMKTHLALLLVASLTFLGGQCLAESSPDASAGAADGAKPTPRPAEVDLGSQAGSSSASEVGQLINFPDSPLRDVIMTLARQAEVNFQFDPAVALAFSTNTVSVRFENVTALQALEAVLANNGLMMTADPRTHIARITARPKDEPLIPTVLQLKNADPALIAGVLSNALPSRKFFPDSKSGRLVVLVSANDMTLVTNLIATMDLPARQILIEARFIETTKNPKSIKGVDWTGTLQGQKVSFGNGLTTSGATSTTSPGASQQTTLPSGRTVTSPAASTSVSQVNQGFSASKADSLLGLTANTARGFSPATAFLNADGVSAVLSFLNTEADSESIAMPRAVALEGNQTIFAVVRNIPVFEEEQGQMNAGGSQQPPTVKPNYRLTGGVTNSVLNEVGVKLAVTPRVLAETNVFLNLTPEISVVEADPERKTLGGKVNEAPIFARRNITTQAIVPSGNTLVLGGLMSDETNKAFTKVPLLGDLPGIGLAFRKDTKERSKRNLLIFVTPTIISEQDFVPDASGHQFLKSKAPVDLGPDPGAIDAGAPKSWSKGTSPASSKPASQGSKP